MEKTCSFLVGMVVLRGMSTVITPPAVSRPRDSGMTSSSSRSCTFSWVSPFRMAACGEEGGGTAGGRSKDQDGSECERTAAGRTAQPTAEPHKPRFRPEQQPIALLPCTRPLLSGPHLHCGAIGDGLIGVDGLAQLLSVEEVLEQLLHLGDAGGAADLHQEWVEGAGLHQGLQGGAPGL